MMLGNYVRVIREGAGPVEGMLLRQDQTGATVETFGGGAGLPPDRLFIPYARIVEIRDLGRIPR